MKKVYNVESIPAVKSLSDYFGTQNKSLPPRIINDINNVLEGMEKLDKEVKQKEQLLVQKEKELVRLKSITDNSSKVARDIISESKGNLDQAVSLHKLGKFSEALKYSDIALYNIGDIDNLGLKTIAQANNLYLERKQQHVDSASKRDYLYNSSVVNGVNAFGWVKSNPTRDFYTFFREALNIPDKEQKSPDNVRIIKKLYELLPLYVEEAQRTNYFYNEYNKYHDVLLKLQQAINIYNIKAASSKGLKDYEDALKTCDIALEIDPKNLTLSNLKNAILQEKQVVEVKKVEEEKLLVSQTKEIDKLKEILARKEVETQEKNKLLTQKGNELASKEKVLIDKHQKETEDLKVLLARKELEHQELLARKDKEVKELEKVNNDVLIKEFIEILPQRYPDLYPNNFAEWSNDIWGKQIVDGNDIEAIKHYLPIYRKEVIENLNQSILAERIRIEELLVEKANIQQKLIDKDNLLSDQTEDIERINVLLETKKIIIQRLEQEKEILQTRHDILDMKMQLTVKEFTVREREKDKALLEKDNELKKLAESSKLLAGYKEEMLKFKELCAIKDTEIKDKDELLSQKELEKQELLAQKEIEKVVLLEDLQEKLHSKDSEILGLQMMVNDMNLAGEYHIVELND